MLSFPTNHRPRIHVHGFTTEEDTPIDDFASRAAAVMGCSVQNMEYILGNAPENISRGVCWGHVVRDVAPKKVMVCLSFLLPDCVMDAEDAYPLILEKEL